MQVVLDRAWTDEQAYADLRIRQALASKPRNLFLLGRELIAPGRRSLAYRLAGRAQLPSCALGERPGAHLVEQLVREAQLFSRVESPALAAQPLAVQQARARQL